MVRRRELPRGFIILTVALFLFTLPLTVFADNRDVLDRANVLDSQAEQEIEDINKYQLKDVNGGHPQIAVITVKGTGSDTIEDYAQKQFDKYHFGQKDKDNGVLLVVDVTSHQVRMQTGYGLEAKVPDAYIDDLLTKKVKNELKEKDYSTATVTMVQKLADRITGKDNNTSEGKVVDQAHVLNQPEISRQLDQVNQELANKHVHSQLTVVTTNKADDSMTETGKVDEQYDQLRLGKDDDNRNMLLYVNPAEQKISLYFPGSEYVTKYINGNLQKKMPTNFTDCNQLVSAWLNGIPQQMNQIGSNAAAMYRYHINDRAGILTNAEQKQIRQDFKKAAFIDNYGAIGLITVDGTDNQSLEQFTNQQFNLTYFDYNDQKLFSSPSQDDLPYDDDSMLIVYDKKTAKYAVHIGAGLKKEKLSQQKVQRFVTQAQKKYPDSLVKQVTYITKSSNGVIDHNLNADGGESMWDKLFLSKWFAPGIFLALILLGTILGERINPDDSDDDSSGGSDSFGGSGGSSGGGGGTGSW